MTGSKLGLGSAALFSLLACGGGGSTSGPDASIDDATTGMDVKVDAAVDADSAPPIVIPQSCNGSVASTSTPATSLPAVPSQLTVPTGFAIEVVGVVGAARELAALPNGDLLVATTGSAIYIIPNAEADGAPGQSAQFASASDTYPAGITYVPTTCAVYLGTNQGIYELTYKDAQLTGDFGSPIAKVRQGTPTPNSDGDVHKTTSVAFAGSQVYAAVGSGCNACTEVDPTRATIQVMDADGSNMTTRATQMRNAIAITTNPASGMIWAGGAGQDDICDNFPSFCPSGTGHPYEYLDAVTSHTGTVNYGWPSCEENHNPFGSGADCTDEPVPLIELPAYSTIIGASFYANSTGAHAFPKPYQGGVFITAHGSWHTNADGSYFSSPLVVFVAMNGDTPVTPVNWSDPTAQWTTFIGGFQNPDSTTRHGRPTGVAVGSKGSLFIGDDANGYVYRIRPT